MSVNDKNALHTAESILALLHYRGIVDTQANRDDVAKALTEVRGALGMGGIYQARPLYVPTKRKWWHR